MFNKYVDKIKKKISGKLDSSSETVEAKATNEKAEPLSKTRSTGKKKGEKNAGTIGDLLQNEIKKDVLQSEENEKSSNNNFSKTGKSLSKQSVGDEKEGSLQSITMRIEWLEGKLQESEESKSDLFRKMLDLSERIGELRSMVLERERRINDIELSVTKATDIVEDIEPKKISQKMEKLNSRMSERDNVIESNTKSIEMVKSLVSELQGELSKIGNVEPLANMHKEFSRMLTDTENKRRDVVGICAKVESIFEELSMRTSTLESMKSQMEKQDDIIKTSLKELDALEVQMSALKNVPELAKKINEFSSKKDLDSQNLRLSETMKELHSTVESISKDLNAKVDAVSARSLETAKALQESKKGVDRISDIAKRLDVMANEMRVIKQNEDVGADINRVLSEYEKIANSWKWSADKKFNDMDSKMTLVTSTLEDILKQIESIKLEISGYTREKNSLNGDAENRLNEINNRIEEFYENINSILEDTQKIKTVVDINEEEMASWKSNIEKQFKELKNVAHADAKTQIEYPGNWQHTINEKSVNPAWDAELDVSSVTSGGSLHDIVAPEMNLTETDNIDEAHNFVSEETSTAINEAINNLNEATALIKAGKLDEAKKPYDNALGVYFTLIMSGNRGARQNTISLYNKLKKMQTVLKNGE